MNQCCNCRDKQDAVPDGGVPTVHDGDSDCRNYGADGQHQYEADVEYTYVIQLLTTYPSHEPVVHECEEHIADHCCISSGDEPEQWDADKIEHHVGYGARRLCPKFYANVVAPSSGAVSAR